MDKRVKDITGKKFGMLTAVRYVEPPNKNTLWEFKCECGNFVVKQYASVNARASKKGGNPSCGCKETENRSNVQKTHGMNSHPACRIWSGMKTRCLNKCVKEWDNYGGRGITICDRWLESFENFWEDMGATWKEGLSIDRIDNNGNYEPANCRWATDKEQGRNRRNNRYIDTTNGKILLTDAARIAGVSMQTMGDRIKRGWDIDKLLSNATTTKEIDTPNGSMTIPDAALFYGIKYQTLFYRIKHGHDKSTWFNKPIHIRGL